MSKIIPIMNVPNQSLSTQIGDIRYDIRLHDVNQAMTIDLSIDDNLIFEGQRLIEGMPIIPYKYLADDNFILLTESNELPDWERFGITQYLMHVSADDIEAANDN